MRRPGIRNLFCPIIVFLLVAGGAVLTSRVAADAGENGIRVAVKDMAWVRGKKVYLKDVARIDGPGHIAEALGEIYLAYAPAPGREKKLHGKWIVSKIRSKAWVPQDIAVSVGEFISVGRRSQGVDDETFLDLYRDYVADRLDDGKVDFQVRRFKVIGNRPFPEGELEIKLADLGVGEYGGNITLSAVVYIDGEIERRVSLSGWVDRFEDVVCCRRALARHSVISKADLYLRKKNVSKLSGDVIKVLEAAVGKRLKHGMKAGAVLTINRLEEVPVVKRGDRVNIVAESDSLRITALGIVEEKGSVGDQIRVKNCMGKREVVAGVVDSSTVKIEF